MEGKIGLGFKSKGVLVRDCEGDHDLGANK